MAALAGADRARRLRSRGAARPTRCWRKLGRSLGLARPERRGAEAARRSARWPRASTPTCARARDRLIAIHGLEGQRRGGSRSRALAGDVRTDAPVDEGKAAVMGGRRVRRADRPRRRSRGRRTHASAPACSPARSWARSAAPASRAAINVARGRTRGDAPLGRCVSRRARRLGAAALPRGRALRPRTRRMEGERRAGALARASCRRSLDAHRDQRAAVWALRASDAAAIEPRLRALLADCALAVLDALYPDAGVRGAADGADRQRCASASTHSATSAGPR